MNNGRYVDKDTIIKRVNQYYGLDATGKDVDDFIYDGLRGLGTYNTYDFIATSGINGMPEPIEIENYRGILPSNVEFPIQVLDYDSKSPMLCLNSIFRSEFNLVVPNNVTKTYELKRNHIFTNVPSHKIILVYLGFALDDYGYPLVPDNENYLKAITAYVAKSIGFPLYLKGQLNGNIYSAIEQDYYAQAHGVNDIEQPNVDQMEMLKNQMMKAIPNYQSYASNFSGVGQASHIKHV